MPTGAGAEMLSAVKYSTIKPMGKTENYNPGERITFDISDRYSYFSGKNSYLYVEVENLSSQTGSSVKPQVMFPPHTGAHALFSRVQYQEKMTAKDLEDIDAYNLYVGLMKSHAYDFEEYDAMARVEGVSAHNPLAEHRCVGDANNQYFALPPALTHDSAAKTTTIEGGTTAITASFCLPIHLGMWSGFGDDNQVLPNGPLGGTQLHLYLEQANNCLQDLSNKFSGSNSTIYQHKNVTDDYNLEDTVTNDGTNDTVTLKDFTVKANSGGESIVKDLGFRVGQMIDINYLVYANSGVDETPATKTAAITAVTITNTDAAHKVTLSFATQSIPDLSNSKEDDKRAPGSINFSLADVTKNYQISKIELRVLETMPSNPKALSAVLARGINYKTVVLNKLSTPEKLQNVILNLPASNTKALSFFCCPNAQDGLNLSNDSNTLLYPQQEDSVDYEYVWQIGNNLIPNRPVVISKDVNKKSDNVVHYSQVQMATRPMYDCHAVNDGTIPDVKELGNPLFIPLLLAPMGNSFNLLNQEGQLRIEHKAASNDLSKVKAKLWHLFCNHTRMVRLLDNSVEVDI